MGAEATRLEQEILGKFLYGRNVALLHTDDRILPVNRRAWASWNYRLTGDPSAPATVTYNMNILQGHRSKNVYCVTLNDEHRINPSKIMARFEYHHSIFTPEWSAVQARHAELLLANRTSYCGGYWRNGFHENGVVSALKVVDAIQSLSESRPSTLNRGRSVAGSAS